MRIKRTLGTLALASTLMLAGCGDDGGDEDAQNDDTTSDTATPTDEATDDETDETEGSEGDEVDIDEFLADFEEGVAATTTARMSMEMDAQGQQIDMEGEVDYTTDPANMAMRMTGGQLGEGEIEMRIVDGKVYMNLGAASQDKFLELSLEQLGSQAGFSDLTDQLDPEAQLEQFRDGLTEVEFVGEESVGDTEDAEHYLLTIDTTKLDEQSPGMPDELDLEVWLDDEHRIIQTTSDLGDMGSLKAQLFDFGSDVNIKKPAASEIQNVPGV